MTPKALARIHARAMTVPAPWTERDFRELLGQSGSILITAPSRKYSGDSTIGAAPLSPEAPTQSEQSTVGFALGRVILDEAELLTLAIDPAHQRCGLGRDCLAAFEREAIRKGALSLFLEVAETNDAARSLYRSAGWVETGRREGYYRAEDARIDAILMTRRPDSD